MVEKCFPLMMLWISSGSSWWWLVLGVWFIFSPFSFEGGTVSLVSSCLQWYVLLKCQWNMSYKLHVTDLSPRQAKYLYLLGNIFFQFYKSHTNMDTHLRHAGCVQPVAVMGGIAL